MTSTRASGTFSPRESPGLSSPREAFPDLALGGGRSPPGRETCIKVPIGCLGPRQGHLEDEKPGQRRTVMSFLGLPDLPIKLGVGGQEQPKAALPKPLSRPTSPELKHTAFGHAFVPASPARGRGPTSRVEERLAMAAVASARSGHSGAASPRGVARISPLSVAASGTASPREGPRPMSPGGEVSTRHGAASPNMASSRHGAASPNMASSRADSRAVSRADSRATSPSPDRNVTWDSAPTRGAPPLPGQRPIQMLYEDEPMLRASSPTLSRQSSSSRTEPAALERGMQASAEEQRQARGRAAQRATPPESRPVSTPPESRPVSTQRATPPESRPVSRPGSPLPYAKSGHATPAEGGSSLVHMRAKAAVANANARWLAAAAATDIAMGQAKSSNENRRKLKNIYDEHRVSDKRYKYEVALADAAERAEAVQEAQVDRALELAKAIGLYLHKAQRPPKVKFELGTPPLSKRGAKGSSIEALRMEGGSISDTGELAGAALGTALGDLGGGYGGSSALHLMKASLTARLATSAVELAVTERQLADAEQAYKPSSAASSGASAPRESTSLEGLNGHIGAKILLREVEPDSVAHYLNRRNPNELQPSIEESRPEEKCVVLYRRPGESLGLRISVDREGGPPIISEVSRTPPAPLHAHHQPHAPLSLPPSHLTPH